MNGALLSVSEIGLEPSFSGKVRDIFAFPDVLVIVATDRISAYDVVLPDPIPGKGIILTQMTLGWYRCMGRDISTHFLSSCVEDFPAPLQGREELQGRSMMVRRADRFPVECVVRGYLAGSGWREYEQSGEVGGIELPAGLREAERLPEPIFTPATKAESGHDENITFAEMCRLVGEDEAEELRRMSLATYFQAHEYALKRGMILADTKFEFGRAEGRTIFIDEMLSPDSSRFWPAEDYHPGCSQLSFDKQYVRDYLDGLGWDHSPPAPRLPEEVVEKTRARYMEALKRLFPELSSEVDK